MVKIAQWGNSLGIRIPKHIVEKAQLVEGMDIEISNEGNKLILTPRRTQKSTLEELLEGMTEENLHSEVDWGEPMGREQW